MFTKNSDADYIKTDDDCTKLENKTPNKKKVRHGAFNVVDFNGRKIKAKHRCSAWFMLCVENSDVSDTKFLKDFVEGLGYRILFIKNFSTI